LRVTTTVLPGSTPRRAQNPATDHDITQALDGDPLVLMWATPTDGSGPEAVEDILRAETAGGGIARLRWYYFCPDVLAEVGDRLGVPYRAHGHGL
ncbi:hypothetical protein, partial [Streptomyces sp. NPDC058486]|uniref:hypothetical protein n=1 Tax=unclassified Streptomyces TaxID=2593676 RepID=UPI00364BD665